MSQNHGPFGLDKHAYATFAPTRTLLVVVHHYTALTRLGDVLPLVESDPRIQVVYTVPPSSVFAPAAQKRLERGHGVLIPWSTAVSCSFDAAIAAGSGGLHQLHAPVISLSHGHGPGKLQLRTEGFGPPVPRSISAVTAAALTSHGRVVPAAIGVAHERHRRLIEQAVPEAAPVCRLVGDPCYDRILASRGHRRRYREALGAGEKQRLIVVSSTWRRASLLGLRPDLPERLVAELSPADYRVAAIPHPCSWAWHGPRQLRAWFAPAQRAGLGLIPPEEGWRAALVAADLVIGDHGSVTYYAAALGRPVLLGAFPARELHAEAAPLRLARQAPHLEADRPLEKQVEAAVTGYEPHRAASYAAWLTSVPGEASRRLRSTVYEVLGLAEPAAEARTAPVPPPRPLPALEPEEGML